MNEDGQRSNAPGPGKLRSVVTYLEMTEPPAGDPPTPPASNVVIRHIRRPGVQFYRHLYDTVGEDWLWVDRRRMTDKELLAILSDKRVEVHVLMVGPEIAGYVELDFRHGSDVEIAYLGIVPAYVGRRLGPYLLGWAAARAFDGGATRLWMHTCTFDHPKAVDFYVAGGFVHYKTVVEEIEDPRLTGLMPRTAAPHIPLAEEK